ncbi:MAG: peptidylprolyl isomerase [Planctomycetes bacterium]|nr:peptidylprolyl isomerase [Planctomycetota bacterium]
MRPIRSLILLCLCCLVAGLPACKRDKEVRRELEQAKLDAVRAETPQLFDPEWQIPPTPEVYIAWVRTTKGACWIEVHRDWAPNAADQFWRLTNSSYYSQMPIYRALKGRLIQWGIHVKPEISAIWKDRCFEPDPMLKSNLEGYAGIAPDPSMGNKLSTQVYINLSDNFHLDEQGFVPFGRVLRGLDRMRQVYSGYDEVAQYGNQAGVDMTLAWESGVRYLRKTFPKLDLVKSTVLKPEYGTESEDGQDEGDDEAGGR